MHSGYILTSTLATTQLYTMLERSVSSSAHVILWNRDDAATTYVMVERVAAHTHHLGCRPPPPRGRYAHSELPGTARWLCQRPAGSCHQQWPAACHRGCSTRRQWRPRGPAFMAHERAQAKSVIHVVGTCKGSHQSLKMASGGTMTRMVRPCSQDQGFTLSVACSCGHSL